MRKFIIFLVLVYASFLNGATYVVGSVNAFNYRVRNVNDGDIIRVRAGTYTIRQIEIRDEITIEAFDENNPPTFESHWTVSIARALFNVYSRKLAFKNIKINTNVVAVKFETNSGEYEFVNVDINKPLNTQTAIQMNNTQNSILIENCNFYSQSSVAFMELRANNINIINSKINSSVEAIHIWSANNVNLINTDVTVRNGAVGVDGSTITGAIKIRDTQNLSIIGGKITGASAGRGTRSIEIGRGVQNVIFDSVCIYRGYVGVGVNAENAKNIKITNSTFQNYRSLGFWYDTTSILNISNSCLYGHSPLPPQSNNSSSNSFNGNYWQDTGFRNRYDSAPLNSCPSTNNCVYEPRLVVEHRFDGCRLKDGDIDEDSVGDYNGTLRGAVTTDPIVNESKICNAMTFYEEGDGVIEIPGISDILNKSATLMFWIRTNQEGNEHTWNSPCIFGKEVNSGINDIFWGWIHEDGRIGVSTGDDITARSNTPINDGYWHHVALMRDSLTNEYKIYIDGELEKEGKISYANPDLSGLVYTKMGDNEGIDEGNFYGSLDELKIYNGVITTAEVKEVYDSEKDGSTRTCSCDKLEKCYSIDFNTDKQNNTWKEVSGSNVVKGNNFAPYHPELKDKRLVITEQAPQIRAGVSINGSVPSSNNIILTEFKHYVHGGSAVGTAVVFSDAAISPKLGGYISSLGYAHSESITNNPADPTPIRNAGYVPGFAGGWLGIGLDEHMYFSSSGYKRLQGGPQYQRRNTIAVRGRITDDIATSTTYLKGTRTLNPPINDTGSDGRKYKMALLGDTKMLSISRQIGTKWRRVANYDVTQGGGVPSDLKVSFTATNGGWHETHAIDDLSFEAIDCGTLGEEEEEEKPKQFKFDAWDEFRSINDRNISTKIVNSEFDLTIASLDENGSDFQDFNGTVCVRVIDDKEQNLTSWEKWQVEDKNITTRSFTSQKASKNARTQIVWKKDVDELCPLSDETNSTISSDNFAIRPSAFNINAPTIVKSGEDFNITFEGLQNGSGVARDYNESVNSSFLVNFKEQKSSCINGNFDDNISSGWKFENGIKIMENSYDEVGIVDINISDISLPCDRLYASVDCKDKNISGYWNTDNDIEIGEDRIAITFTLDHFEIDANLSNFQGGDFTYLANDVMNMYAPLDINLMAKNADGNTTKNYNPDCYAKTSEMDISYEHTTINSDIINTIITHELNTSSDLNQTFSDKKLDLSLPNTIFDDGNASLHVRLNFDRNISNPINPFDINISDINISDIDGVTDTVQTIDGNASFFYGRVRPVDLTTTSNNARTYGEFEIYDTSHRTDMLQNSLHWYRNRLHVNSNYGRLSNPRDSIFGGTVPSATTMLNVNLGTNVSMGLQNINISPTLTSSTTRTVHFETNTWEWFTSSDSPRPYNADGSCLVHPCLDYEFRVSGTAIVHSGGDFHGSDVNLTKFDSNQTEKRGVKVFR